VTPIKMPDMLSDDERTDQEASVRVYSARWFMKPFVAELEPIGDLEIT
jgi:hypothetical protein